MGKKFCQNRSISLYSEINVLLHFTQKFKVVAKSGGDSDFCLKLSVDSSYTLRAKNFVEIALSCTVSEVSVFMFHTEIQDGHQI